MYGYKELLSSSNGDKTKLCYLMADALYNYRDWKGKIGCLTVEKTSDAVYTIVDNDEKMFDISLKKDGHMFYSFSSDYNIDNGLSALQNMFYINERHYQVIHKYGGDVVYILSKQDREDIIKLAVYFQFLCEENVGDSISLDQKEICEFICSHSETIIDIYIPEEEKHVAEENQIDIYHVRESLCGPNQEWQIELEKKFELKKEEIINEIHQLKSVVEFKK